MKVTDSPATWRAVAHPLRRRLIELLADGPRTTGQLAASFPVTRFAVMKHLAVLERAGVVTARKHGRTCWNALTVGVGFDLEIRGSASAGQQPAAENLPNPSCFTSFRTERRVLLDASPARVFDALTFNVSAWWGAPYLRSSRATNVILEPQLGGRFFEEWGHRQGFMRGVVIAIRQDERLELAGRIAGNGSLPSALEITLKARDRATELGLVHRGVTEASAEGGDGEAARYDAAWTELIDERLKEFVEHGARSGIANRPPSDDALYGWF